jgi:hypothetical protein
MYKDTRVTPSGANCCLMKVSDGRWYGILATSTSTPHSNARRYYEAFHLDQSPRLKQDDSLLIGFRMLHKETREYQSKYWFISVNQEAASKTSYWRCFQEPVKESDFRKCGNNCGVLCNISSVISKPVILKEIARHSFLDNTCPGLCSFTYLANRRSQSAPLLSRCHTCTSGMSDTCDKVSSVILQLLIVIVNKCGEMYTPNLKHFSILLEQLRTFFRFTIPVV